MSRGLQLDNPKVNGTFDPFTKMLRQRAWAGCLVMEPTSSVMLCVLRPFLPPLLSLCAG